MIVVNIEPRRAGGLAGAANNLPSDTVDLLWQKCHRSLLGHVVSKFFF